METPRTIRSQRHAQSRVCVCDRIAGPVSARAAYIARVMLRCIALKVPTTIDSIMAGAGRVTTTTTTTRLQTTCRRRRRRGECTTLISAFINLNNNELIFFLPRLYLLASCGAVAKSTFTLWPRGFCPIGNVMISAYFRGPISHTLNGIDMCVTRGWPSPLQLLCVLGGAATISVKILRFLNFCRGYIEWFKFRYIFKLGLVFIHQMSSRLITSWRFTNQICRRPQIKKTFVSSLIQIITKVFDKLVQIMTELVFDDVL